MAIVIPVLQVIFLFDNTTSGQYNLLMVLVPGRLSLAGFLDKTKQTNPHAHTPKRTYFQHTADAGKPNSGLKKIIV